MRILGIDPGLATMGYGLIEQTDAHSDRARCVKYGIIVTYAGEPLAERLSSIGRQCKRLFRTTRPDALAIEKNYFSANKTSALLVAHARGVVLASAHDAHIPVYELQPLAIKQTVSAFGRAPKRQVQRAIARILGLSRIPAPDDAADALACAFTALPLVQRAGLGR